MAPLTARVGWLIGLARDEPAHDIGGGAVGLFEEMGVDVESCRSVAVPEPAGDGANVNPCAEQLRRDKVAQIVEANTGQSLLLAQPLEAA